MSYYLLIKYNILFSHDVAMEALTLAAEERGTGVQRFEPIIPCLTKAENPNAKVELKYLFKIFMLQLYRILL